MKKVLELTLLNPHADDFVSMPVSFRLVGRRGLRKYGYLLDEPIRRGRRPAVLVDGTLSSLFDQATFNRMPKWLRGLILRIEIFFWLRINRLTDKVDVYWSPGEITDRRAIYVFSYKNCVGAFEQRRETLAAFDHAIINLSHYFIRTREKVENISKLPNALLHSDGDLASNPFFQRFFSGRKIDIALPFAVGRRFAAIRPQSERSPKCAATGSFHNLQHEEPAIYYRDFIEFFGVTTYHPVRKLLYENRDKLLDWLDCRVSPYRENRERVWLLARLRQAARLDAVQSKYFSFDIVAFYNEHMFAIVGEEISGSPAIGFFEAMACGCVMLAERGSYYDGLGLEAGTHYLPHDGTIASIRDAIAAVADDRDRLASIAAAGRDYIRKNCPPEAVWDGFERKLCQLSEQNTP